MINIFHYTNSHLLVLSLYCLFQSIVSIFKKMGKFRIFSIFLLANLAINSHSIHASTCVLDMEIPSSWNDSSSMEGNWGGFLKNESCARTLERYLYALAKNANETGEIFQNTTDQKVCFNAINITEEDVLSCGIERLSSGRGGCSDYSLKDVVNEEKTQLQSLDEGCKNSESESSSNEECSSCLKRWEEMSIAAHNSTSNGTSREEVDVCRFSILVSLTSRRISDMGWIESIYACLRDGVPLGKLHISCNSRVFFF